MDQVAPTDEPPAAVTDTTVPTTTTGAATDPPTTESPIDMKQILLHGKLHFPVILFSLSRLINTCLFSEGRIRDRRDWLVTASSIWCPICLASLVIDDTAHYFHSGGEFQTPWLQIDLRKRFVIKKATFTQRWDCCWQRMEYIQVGNRGNLF